MIKNITAKQLFAIKSIVVLSILVPLTILTYETIVLGKNHVVFLQDYPNFISFSILIYYSLILVFGFIWLVIQLKSITVLKTEKKKNELMHLQNQVNPHFFFNMLNNLYGVVGKDTAKAKSLILKLSELMRYSIYEGEKAEVSISEEINYLESFIELNKIRYHKQVDIQLDINIADHNYKLMPLMFITLLENAFKHGVDTKRDKAFVSIKLSDLNNVIYFEVKNNYEISDYNKPEGIGLKNLKRRLILAYPKRHSLHITNKDSVFKATLQIKK